MAPARPARSSRPGSGLYDPRRRLRWLAVITVAALLPLGIGWGVGELVGGGPGRASTAAPPALPPRPPTATLATRGAATVTALLGSYCWSSGGRGGCADAVTDTPAHEPVLHVARGAPVTVAFATRDSPSAVSVGPTSGPSHPLVPGNPTRFSFTVSPGSYAIVIDATWAARRRGQASYLVRVVVG